MKYKPIKFAVLDVNESVKCLIPPLSQEALDWLHDTGMITDSESLLEKEADRVGKDCLKYMQKKGLANGEMRHI